MLTTSEGSHLMPTIRTRTWLPVCIRVLWSDEIQLLSARLSCSNSSGMSCAGVGRGRPQAAAGAEAVRAGGTPPGRPRGRAAQMHTASRNQGMHCCDAHSLFPIPPHHHHHHWNHTKTCNTMLCTRRIGRQPSNPCQHERSMALTWAETKSCRGPAWAKKPICRG